MRWVVFLGGGLGLLGLFIALLQIAPPPTGVLDKYSDLQLATVERLEGIIDTNFTMATAVTGALGALALGLGGGVKLTRRQAPPVFIAVVFSVGSALAGVVARMNLVEMLANGAQPYLSEQIIQAPMQIQQYLLLASIAAIGWLVVDGVLKAE